MHDSSWPSRRRSPIQIARRWFWNLCAAIGLIVLLVTLTPIDFWWAHAYAGSVEIPKGDVLIVLSAANDDNGTISYSSYWRARYALLAWHTGHFRTVVITGGGGPGIRNFLVAEGLPPQAIVAEWRSTSTRENALNTANLVRDMPGTKVLLTSDFHMFRAQRVFQKAGVQVLTAPAPDVMKASQHLNGRFPGFETLVLESVKIVYYRLHGWM